MFYMFFFPVNYNNFFYFYINNIAVDEKITFFFFIYTIDLFTQLQVVY